MKNATARASSCREQKSKRLRAGTIDWIQVTPAAAFGRRRSASSTVTGSFAPPATYTVMPGSSRAGTSSGEMKVGIFGFCRSVAIG